MSQALYGVVAEFTTAEQLIAAAKRVRANGYRKVEAYAPFAIEELDEALALPKNRVPLVVLLGALAGGIGGYFMMWYSATTDYPINVGGRPLHSWPAFIPITFELAVLLAALCAFFGMFAMNGLPRLHHPIFSTPHFSERNATCFYLCLLAQDPQFSVPEATHLLQSLEAEATWEVLR